MEQAEKVAVAKRLVLLGPPGAGKGTQAKVLAENLGLLHIASGDLFRYHQQKGTPLGLKTMEYMSQGLLVPDEITIAIVLEHVLSPAALRGALLDGFPRNLAQAQALDDALEDRGMAIDRVILVSVPEQELIRRLSGRLVCRQCQTPYHPKTAPPEVEGRCDRCQGQLYQRQDDTADAIMVRIQVYRDETAPLIDHYEGTGKLSEVDGVGTVEEIGQRLLQSLEN